MRCSDCKSNFPAPGISSVLSSSASFLNIPQRSRSSCRSSMIFLFSQPSQDIPLSRSSRSRLFGVYKIISTHKLTSLETIEYGSIYSPKPLVNHLYELVIITSSRKETLPFKIKPDRHCSTDSFLFWVQRNSQFVMMHIHSRLVFC